MTTTLNDDASSDEPEGGASPTAQELAAVELVRLAREASLSLTGPQGLLKQFTKTVLETAFGRRSDRTSGLPEICSPDDS